MQFILTEEQYNRLILSESMKDANRQLQGFINIGKEALENTKQILGFDYRFLLSYTMGIGALIGPTINFLQNKGFSLSSEEMMMLAVSAISVVFIETEIKKNEIESKISELGLDEPFEVTKSFIEKTKDWFTAMFEAIPNMIQRGSNILAYTFLIPIASALIKGIDFKNIDEVVLVLKHFFSNMGINFAGSLLKSVAEKIVSKVKQ